MMTNSAATPQDPKSKICFLRVTFVASMAVAAAVCGSIAFMAVRRLENDLAQQTYKSVSLSALMGAQAITLRRIQTIAIVASYHNYAFPNASQWPYVALPGFVDTAAQMAELSKSLVVNLNVIVYPSQVSEFERFAAATYTDVGYPNGTGESDFGFGIWAHDTTVPPLYPDGRVHDTTGRQNSNHAILAPILQGSNTSAPIFLYNSHSEEFRGIAIDSMMDCAAVATSKNATKHPSCSAATDFVELITRPGPAAVLYTPIYPQKDPTTVVGMITATIHWADVLVNVVPNYVDGLYCVVSSNEKSYTYVINDGVPELLGEGDLHDAAFDAYKTSVVLNDIETNALASAVFTLTVYPSCRMVDTFQTNSPLWISIGFVSVILFSAGLFFLYDCFMRHDSRQRRTILEVKRRFVRFVSHEIRTPLNTVCLGLELLQAELSPSSNSRSMLTAEMNSSHSTDRSEDMQRHWLHLTEDILENANNAVGILNDLLNYDKIEQGTFRLEVGTVYIWELVRVTVSSFHIQAEKRKILLKYKSTDSEINGDEEQRANSHDFSRLNVVGDDTRLRQVIRNLLSNALKFSAEETGVIQVTASYDPEGLPKASAPKGHVLRKVECTELACSYPRAGSIVISVEDNGIGMSVEQLNRLFLEGVQFDANKNQNGGGSGLGLHITKSLVEQHGGVIAMNSAGLGCGATVTVELPLYEFPESERARPKIKLEIDSLPDDSSSRRTHHVLVVDDALPNRKMLVRILERSGHKCVSACNGLEAVNAYAASRDGGSPFDTILMDYEMPVLNGPDASQQLREMGCTAFIVGVTGNVLAEDIEYFVSMGADAVLAKPVQIALLDEFWVQRQVS